MNSKEFEDKYGKVYVAMDLKKKLVQFSVGGMTPRPVHASLCLNENFVYKGRVFTIYGTPNMAKIFVLGTEDKVTVKVIHKDIEYNPIVAVDNICDTLATRTVLTDCAVKDIITYFKEVNVIYKHPCIIENPDDTMIGGIPIRQIVNGRAFEYDEEGKSERVFNVEDFDDETLIRLFNWIEFGQYNQPKK